LLKRQPRAAQQTIQAEQVRQSQARQIAGEEETEFQRGLQLRQQKRLEEGQKFGQELAEKKLAQAGELGRLKAAGKAKTARTLPKQPSKTPGFFVQQLAKLDSEEADFLNEQDEEGNFVNQKQRNNFLDSLDVYAQRNPNATDEDAVRYASRVAGLLLEGKTVPPSGTEATTAAPGQQAEVPAAAAPRRQLSPAMKRRAERLTETIDKAEARGQKSVVRSLTAQRDKILKGDETGRQTPRRIAPQRKKTADFDPAGRVGRQTPRRLIRTGSLEEGTASITQETDEERGVRELFGGEGSPEREVDQAATQEAVPRRLSRGVAGQRTLPAEAAPEEVAAPTRRIGKQLVADGPRRALVGLAREPRVKPFGLGGNRLIDMLSGREPEPEPAVASRPQRSLTQGIREVAPISGFGKIAIGADAATGGPAIRERQRSLAALDNASQAVRSGNVPAAEQANVQVLMREANNLLQKENLSQAEQDKLDRIIKVFSTRYTQ
jgi:hypothetical protein